MTKADSLNNSEIGAKCTSKEGGKPIRKRGFHRALKRGESWAVMKQAWTNQLAAFNKMLYEDMYRISALQESNVDFIGGAFYSDPRIKY